MLEISKSILSRVSFDEHLFGKELNKLIFFMENNQGEELEQLKRWCEDTYGNLYGKMIRRAFKKTHQYA